MMTVNFVFCMKVNIAMKILASCINSFQSILHFVFYGELPFLFQIFFGFDLSFYIVEEQLQQLAYSCCRDYFRICIIKGKLQQMCYLVL